MDSVFREPCEPLKVGMYIVGGCSRSGTIAEDGNKRRLWWNADPLAAVEFYNRATANEKPF